MQDIFVFGSSICGVHRAGAAKFARKNHGAKWGVGVGIQGNAYGIPTKDIRLMPLPLPRIEDYVDHFLGYAIQHPEVTFKVTRIGCGLAGYMNNEIAPMFWTAPKNCMFDKQWMDYLPGYTYF